MISCGSPEGWRAEFAQGHPLQSRQCRQPFLDAGWVAQECETLSRKLPSPEDAPSPHPYRFAKGPVFTTHLSQTNFPTPWLCDLLTGHCLPLGLNFQM